MLEWLMGRTTEFDYPPPPPWRPAHDRLHLSKEGKTLIATDGGTDDPTPIDAPVILASAFMA